MPPIPTITRRQWAHLLAGAALGTAIPALAAAPDRKDTLVLGLDIADTVTFDPARQANYSPPLTLAAAYDTLVTYNPGHYEDVVPSLAKTWQSLQDGALWRFTLRPDARFASGNPVTADDCRFSLERLLAIADEPAQFLAAVSAIAATAPDTLDIQLRTPGAPLLPILAATSFAVLERKLVEAHGGTDLPNARDADMATGWLNQHSAGTGSYTLTGWARSDRIELTANPNSWRGPPAYRRIVIHHIPDATAQMRALQRGAIDVAFNLLPDQLTLLGTDDQVRIESTTSLDFVYLALNADPAQNKALALRQARQAIGFAIDYDGLIEHLLGAKAVRPASFLPIGVRGSTAAIAKRIGFHEDLDQARSLLAASGLPDGFAFELSYADTAIAGVSYTALARKLRTDLHRIGIEATLRPMDPLALRDRYFAGKAQAALSFWSAPVVDTRLWATASVDRLAKRIDFEPPPDLTSFIDRAAAETDPAQQTEMWIEYQQAMVYRANLIVLFQPIYQVGIRKSVAAFPLTAAGWMAELRAARPAGR